MEFKVFKGRFENANDIIKDFEAPGALDDTKVLLAWYDDVNYEGEAIVIFERDSKLFEVHGYHCSCYGLEGQWEPEETSWEALAMQQDSEVQQLVKFHKEITNG